MDINRDELRRQLRESQREHDALMPSFRSILARLFDPDSKVSRAEKAQVLGVPAGPSRRAMLGGGATLAGAALLAACTEPKPDEQLAQTGTVPNNRTSTTLAPQAAADKAQTEDLTLLRTSQSVEALAIVAYDLAIASNKLSPPVLEAVQLFRRQHLDHQGAIVNQIEEVGGERYRNPNPGDAPSGVSQDEWAQVNPTVWKEAVAPVVADANALNEQALVKLATTLEDAAANTYTKLGGVLSSPELRAFIMSIGGIEARHVAVLLGVTTPDDPRAQVPFAFEKTGGAVPPEAYVGPGEIRRQASTTTSTARPTTTTAGSTGGTTGTTARTGGAGGGGTTTTAAAGGT